MWRKGERYEVVEIDGRWYVIDHKHPDAQPTEYESREQADTDARIWNLLSS